MFLQGRHSQSYFSRKLLEAIDKSNQNCNGKDIESEETLIAGGYNQDEGTEGEIEKDNSNYTRISGKVMLH